MTPEEPSQWSRVAPSSVAYDLMRDILFEDPARPPANSPEFRAYILDLYAECLLAVRGKRAVGLKVSGQKTFRAPRAA